MFRHFFLVFWFIQSQYHVRYTQASQKKREIVVSCIGDSLTYGLGASKLHTLTYPALLQTHLQSQFPTVQWTIHNFGDSGKTALKGTGRHSYWNTETYKKSLAAQPNIVIIQLGMLKYTPLITYSTDTNLSIQRLTLSLTLGVF